MSNNSYKLHVVSVEKEIFSEIVKKIQVLGIEGEMGVFPGHSPLITLIKPGILKISKIYDYEEYIYISGGILEIQQNIVTILADTAIRAEDLDEKQAQESKNLAEEKIKNIHQGDANYAKISAEISKSISKLRLIELTKNKLK